MSNPSLLIPVFTDPADSTLLDMMRQWKQFVDEHQTGTPHEVLRSGVDFELTPEETVLREKIQALCEEKGLDFDSMYLVSIGPDGTSQDPSIMMATFDFEDKIEKDHEQESGTSSTDG